ncbi:PEP-CTERM sorting domain-containing protein [Nostoc sp. ATCC 53789]
MNGTFATVPEPNTLIILISLGIGGVGALLSRCYREEHEKAS